MSVYSAEQLSTIAQNLGAVEDWLNDKCEARHAEDMGDICREAIEVIEDLYDEKIEGQGDVPDIWPVNMRGADKPAVQQLARRRAALNLPHTYADTIRSAIALCLELADEQLGGISDDDAPEN
jgi:hypothetical protein